MRSRAGSRATRNSFCLKNPIWRRVADPAAGSGAIEDLTNKLCAAAWSQFQEIDKAGGAWAALERGLIQKNVAAVRAERQRAAARRKDAITGTSDYPNLNEKLRGCAQRRTAGAAEGSIGASPQPSRCRRIRLAEPFEALRDASDRMLVNTGARPKVFLANLGKLADFTARAMFAKNFYEAGGIEAISNDGFKDQAAMVAAFKASGAKLACLCSSDKVYTRAGRRRRQGADRGRRGRPPCRPPGRARGRMAAGRHQTLHLRGLRRAFDLAGRT